MVQFTTVLKQFAQQGEKTGWTYLDVPIDLAQQLKPGNKKSFRVKGSLDDHAISSVALIPMGGGRFIMAVNATMRKKMGKRKGAMIAVKLEVDNKPLVLSKELMECLQDEPKALTGFKKLSPSHQQYYSKWIQEAKTDQTKTKRIVQAVAALTKGLHFGLMLRALKENKNEDFF
jgi:predicted alpha/beta hydrolase